MGSGAVSGSLREIRIVLGGGNGVWEVVKMLEVVLEIFIVP